MPLKDGDVVRLDFTLLVEGKVHDTSDRQVAQDHGIHRESQRYGPMTVTLGTGQLVPGLESHLRSHGRVAEALSADVAPEDAFGARDPKKVRTVPMGKFRGKDVDPYVGLRLNLDNTPGLVTQVAGGRVRVDTNHELAGKAVRYEYVVRAILEDETDKVQAVVDGFFGPGKATATVAGGVVRVDVPEDAKFDHAWATRKFRLAARLRAATRSKTIHLVEAFADDTGLVPGHEGHRHGRDGHGDDGHHHHDHGDGHGARRSHRHDH